MARAGTLPSYLYKREIQPGEPVGLERSDLEEKQEKDEEEDGMLEYDSPRSDEESAHDETAWDVGEIPSLEREANFLFGRVSRFGRSITSTAEFCWVNFSLFFLLWNYGIAVTFFFFYAFVDIVIRLFDIDLFLLIRFSVIEVKQKEVVTVASVRYSCKTSKTSKMNSNIFLVKKNGSILIEKIITYRKGPFNNCQYMKIIYMWTAVEEITMKAILAVMNTT